MNAEPKIAYVVKRYPRFSETFIVNEILAHEAAGHNVEIISLYPPNDTHFQDALARVRAHVTYLSAEGLKAIELWNALERAAETLPDLWPQLAATRGSEVREVYQAARLAALVRERGIGLLHAHFASTATEVARLAARFAGIPFTFTAHAKDIFHESANAADLQRKLTEAAAVITVSEFNVAHLRREFGAAASNVRRLYNGLDLDRFTFTPPAQRAPRIVAVGRLIEKKGFEVLINACDLLAKRNVPFACDIIGTGERETALRQQISELSLGDRVQLLGPRPQAEVIELVRSAAAFAAPCVVGADGNADGLPTVLLEAMALGTPCVSTDVTGIPEVIRHGETGLQVPQHDATALADALERLLADAALRVHLATNARALIARDFDARRNTAQQWQWFTAIVAARSAGFQTCCVADFQIGKADERSASLEARDTADLEVCATVHPPKPRSSGRKSALSELGKKSEPTHAGCHGPEINNAASSHSPLPSTGRGAGVRGENSLGASPLPSQPKPKRRQRRVPIPA